MAWSYNPLNLVLPLGVVVGWLYSAALVAGWNPPWSQWSLSPRWKRVLRVVAWGTIAAVWLAVIFGPASSGK